MNIRVPHPSKRGTANQTSVYRSPVIGCIMSRSRQDRIATQQLRGTKTPGLVSACKFETKEFIQWKHICTWSRNKAKYLDNKRLTSGNTRRTRLEELASVQRDGETLQRRNIKANSASVLWRRRNKQLKKEAMHAETCEPVFSPSSRFLRETTPSLNVCFPVRNTAGWFRGRWKTPKW